MSEFNNQILLSICIPTYNRANQLENTLKSIINQNIFTSTSKIEIVISDNCSTDDTAVIVNKYLQLYAEKITYSRNDFNIADKNFEKALSIGKGLYLKLNNDTLKHQSNSLDLIVSLLENNINEKPIIFFANGVLHKHGKIEGEGLSFLINTTSFYTTWIATFGIWKEDFLCFTNFNKSSHLQLTQVDVLFDLVKIKKKVIIDDEILFIPEVVTKKGGYDIVTVFLDNYSYLLKQLVESNDINKEVYHNAMDRIINEFLTIWLAKSFVDYKNYNFILNSPLKRINKFYNYNLIKLYVFYKNLSIQCISELKFKFK